ncbi:MAG: winged helix-turn-helix transcriptional regulator [Gammaproteobacteria bacterium]|nr:MAG: MarR family transcriptional regulator [Gammaproteobacteria bacterium]UCH39134.1 MAG: winged helix-turn-helix transcriptional regulator [Gammaproteobacteria bacterium]
MSKREQELNQALEAMHFGFRAMTQQPDQRLAELGLARIHHRLLYFIGRNADCSINELLGIMRVSKQYLHQPLKKMIEGGYIAQKTDATDRRIKRLQLTTKGKKLEFELTEVQRRRFAGIFKKSGARAEKHWREVMALLSENIEF